MLWHISDDLKRFKRITKGHHVLMGRKTLESLGKPLPNRVNLVVTRKKGYKVEGAEVFTSLDTAIEFARQAGEKELFVIGGGEIYRECLDMADRIYITIVYCRPEGSVTFPEVDPDKWKITFAELGHKGPKNDHDFAFIDLERRK